ncbi:MAG: ABC transporter permease, partial [Verrucomicrobiota bacterium]
MMLLPIIQRELLVRARSRESRRLRLGVALMGALSCLPQLLFTTRFAPLSTAGQQIFNGLVVAAFILCCASCLLTADAVASEQREGTLGLLFLTRVKGPDVLLGKLGANGLDALCALVALLPLLMIPVLMGGVTGGEACRKGLALINALGFALAAGLYQSASHRKQFRAAAGAVILVLLIVLLPRIPVPGAARG